MATTREHVLETLLNHPRATIEELAKEVDINAISVRHHLSSLQAEGLIISEEVRHGVGRPRMVYSLSKKGLEKFPGKYMRFANRLLDQIKRDYPQININDLFRDMARDLAKGQKNEGEAVSFEEKLDILKTILTEEGFSMDWEQNGDLVQIHEITCPYYHISHSHPEVCSIDQTLISNVLEIPVEKIRCVLRGDNRCTYIFSRANKQENST